MTSDSAMSRNDTAATATSCSTLHIALMVTDAITVATKVKPILVCFRNPAPGDTNRRAYSTQPLVACATWTHVYCSPDHMVAHARPLADVLREARSVPGSALRRRVPHCRRYTPGVG